MSHLTDDQLLQRFAESRDAEAFDRLVQRHMGLVHATCRRETGDDALAEDAAQATFLVLARKARSLRDERSLASWLFATARLTARNLLREERRRKAREARASAGTEREMNVEDTGAIEPLLNEALGRLKPQDRQAVILRYLEGRSLAEVAAELNVAESAARMRVQRALERMRTNLGRLGVATTVVALVAVLDSQASAAVPPNLLAVSVPPTASSGAGFGTWTLLAKGTTLLLATTTKALVASGVALVVAGGFVFVRSQPVFDDATVRAAFRPLVGRWKGTATVPMPPDGSRKPTAMLVDVKPEKDGLGLALTMRFPDIHQGERKHLSIDSKGQFVVEGQEGQPTERYQSQGIREVAAKGQGKLQFAGRSTEGGRTADLRVSFEIGANRMIMHQSAKPLNGPEQGQDVTLERVK
jgi:RNA polymerase sigma factor (sigma-70 family)